MFLPAAGLSYDGSAINQGYYGNYWSSTPYGSSNAYDLFFASNDQVMDNSDTRDVRSSVRAVLAE